MDVANPPYHVEVRDSSLARAGEVDTLISLEMIPRFAAVGAWELVMPEDSPQADPLVANGARVAIYQHGVTDPVMSGPVRVRQTTWGEADGGRGTLTVSGPDDNYWLDRRLARQVPGSAVASQSGAVQDVRGPSDAESVMRAYVLNNAGASAFSGRPVPGLTLATNGNRGNTVTGTARMSNLLALLRLLAVNGEVGFNVAQSGSGLVFSVYEPQDLTLTARFSRELGNLRKLTYTETAPSANAIVAGGPGADAARTFKEYVDSTSVALWGRVEGYVDASGATLTADLDQIGLQALIDSGQNTALSIETEDTPDLAYFRDYRLGDTVTVEPRLGLVVQDVVRELRIRWDAGTGESKKATVGSFDATGTPAVIKRLQAVQKRLDSQERWR